MAPVSFWTLCPSCLLFSAIYESLKNKTWFKFTFFGLISLSIFIQLLPLYYHSALAWNSRPLNIDLIPERLFSWRDSPFSAFFRDLKADLRTTQQQLDNLIHPFFLNEPYIVPPRLNAAQRNLDLKLIDLNPDIHLFPKEPFRIRIRFHNHGRQPIIFEPSMVQWAVTSFPRPSHRVLSPQVIPLLHLAQNESSEFEIHSQAPLTSGRYVFEIRILPTPKAPFLNSGISLLTIPFAVTPPLSTLPSFQPTSPMTPTPIDVRITRRLWFPGTHDCLRIQSAQNAPPFSILLQDSHKAFYLFYRKGLYRIGPLLSPMFGSLRNPGTFLDCPQLVPYRPARLPTAMKVFLWYRDSRPLATIKFIDQIILYPP